MSDDQPTLMIGQVIDRICDEFENAWLNDDVEPSIEEFLAKVDSSFQAELVAELVAVDIAYRQEKSKPLQIDDYAKRFPFAKSEMRPFLMSLMDGDTKRVESKGHETSLGPQMRTRRMAAIGTDFGSYELLQEIARGGMGVVFRARQKNTNRIVALKMILAGQFANESEIQRFHAEAKAVAKLDHPNIVPVFDAGEHNGYHYIAMAFVDGGNLAEFCGDRALPVESICQIMRSLAIAIEFAHSHNVIHRDLKPANILMSKSLQPKVTDFGLARQIGDDSNMTKTGQVVGTPAFMAPEQALGLVDEIGPATDIYALGAILYSLLVGTPPFRADTPWDTMNKVVKNQPTSPRSLNPSIPKDVETICLKCLEKAPEKRYQSGEELALELTRFLENEPILARPISTTSRVIRWCQRNKLVAALGTGILLTSLAGTAIATNYARLANSRATTLLEANTKLELANKLEKAAKEEAVSQKSRANRKAEEAEEARILSERSAKRALDVLGIVASSFYSTSPDGGADADMTAKEVLLAAQGSLQESELDDEGRAALLETLTSCYIGIGEFDLAVETGRESLSILKRLGAPLPQQASILNLLGVALSNTVHLEEAIEVQSRAVEIAKNHSQLETVRLVYMQNLATSLGEAGYPKKSIKLMEEVLEYHMQQYGLEHTDTLTSLNNLAAEYSGSGKLPQAIELLEKALPIRRKLMGDDHPRTLAAMSNLGLIYSRNGHFDASISILEKAMALAPKKLGSDHPRAFVLMGNLATSYQRAGRLEDAIELLEKTLESMVQKQGETHPNALITMNKLGTAYLANGDKEKAIETHEKAFRIMSETLGETHPAALSARNNLGTAYWKLGMPEKAVPLFEKGLEIIVPKLGDRHPNTVSMRMNLGVNYVAVGNAERGLELMEEATELARNTPAFRTFRIGLKQAYIKTGHAEKLWELLNGDLEKQRETLPKESLELSNVLARIAIDLLKVQEQERSREILEECVAIREKLAADNWTTSNSKSMLGSVLVGVDNERAQELLTSSHEEMFQAQEQIPEAYRELRIQESMERLIRFYEQTDDPEEVAKWQEKLKQFMAGD